MSTKQVSVPPHKRKQEALVEDSPKEPLITSDAKRPRIRKDFESNPIVEVLYKNKDVVIINKEYDLHIDGAAELTVEKLVNAQHPDMIIQPANPTNETRRKLKFAHQLDFATSGIMCLAFTRKSCARIGQCFQDRRACKFYLALLEGILQGHNSKDKTAPIHVHSFIGQDLGDPTGFKMAFSKKKGEIADGRDAETEVYIIEYGEYAGRPVTKVLFKPKSGRRHQLRLHAKQLGHAIVGDVTYSENKEFSTSAPRMCLHAWKLMLPFPDGEVWNIQTKDPFALEKVTEKVRNLQETCDSILPLNIVDKNKYVEVK